MANNPLTTEEKERIRSMLLAGRSHNSIAKMVGRNQSTVSDFARREGITPVNRVPREALEARKHHSLESRIADTNELMQKTLELAKSVSSGREMKDVATSWGILTDKYLLLTGQPTSRSETHSKRSADAAVLNLEEEFRRLDELAASDEERIRRDNE